MQWPSKLSSHSPQNFSLRKISYIFPKKKIFRKIELSSLKLKKLLIFWEMELSYIFSTKAFLIFWKTELFKKTSYV